ncbi:NAD(P)-dependent dehydrogenase (short-subunit alcohol dehydrogenase family) [Streptomyces umbrinus]|uniref:NAD(P)-dependent dehydrogenase (Short-subunit alcohol dehydrogenase family) n=1 Tax=Streptomyces umbrinus TaxID=67370 RepID=A0ABU0SK71_9ACTN|nr:SDR family NAD(P)-dependent oxidoreductase [Streptomyces umbrinus]MDQ1023970.1 NAD(P)-dependent dehydrogenase (short-subunit alcohol dehydrogenase family) [Streptomyces umbrinus]
MSGAVIIGAGPGIGQAVARRFARKGLPITLIARGGQTLRAVAGEVASLGAPLGASHGVPIVTLQADCTDRAELDAALDQAIDEHGVPEVAVYNAALVRADELGEFSVREHMEAWAVNVVGALNAAARLAPAMAARGSGTFLVTGGMPEPEPRYVSLSLGKAGVRTLVALLDQQYGPSGVHVASVTVDGPVALGTDFDPDDIAEHYWQLHTQPRHLWDREVLHAGRC